MRAFVAAGLAAILLSQPLSARPTAAPRAEAQALELAKQTIGMRSVRGPENRTADVAGAYKAAFLAGGWGDGDVEIVPFEDTVYLVASWQGSDPKLKPLVISGHMDVVEARPADWQRDPFTAVVENGMLYGRGAQDMKLDNALAIASLIEMRRRGYRPKRTIVAAFSGDEETTMLTSQRILERLATAELVINVDFDNNGKLDEVTGKPLYWVWQGAEKGYADFELSVTNPGGHSSMPRRDNAINQLAAALGRIAAHRFPPELNPLTKAYFEKASAFEKDRHLAAAMRAFAANPADEQAIAALSAESAMIGRIGTTCVVTMVAGGHAVNALPQRATANVNCRIFPGHGRAEIMAELQKVVADPAMQLRDVTEGSVDSPASKLRPDFTAAAQKAIGSVYPGVPVVPSMATGASDCMWYRSKGIDCYMASPLFLKSSDSLAHGLNERMPVANIRPGIAYYISLFSDLSK